MSKHLPFVVALIAALNEYNSEPKNTGLPAHQRAKTGLNAINTYLRANIVGETTDGSPNTVNANVVTELNKLDHGVCVHNAYVMFTMLAERMFDKLDDEEKAQFAIAHLTLSNIREIERRRTGPIERIMRDMFGNGASARTQ